jgi:Yip1-like protein
MPDAVAATEARPLSEVERVVDTFVAPSKTFADIIRNRSWWLPFIIICVFVFGSAYAIDRTIGFVAVAQHQTEKSSSASERMQQLSPEQRAQSLKTAGNITRIVSYASPVLVLLFVAIEALVLWGSFNFGLGAKTTFSEMFAVIMYAGLPRVFIALLNIILLFAGVNTENFDQQNPVGTNIGYFLTDSPNWLKTFGSFFDIFSIWSIVLLIIGTAIVARKTKGQAAMVILGWWAVCILVFTGIAAATS